MNFSAAPSIPGILPKPMASVVAGNPAARVAVAQRLEAIAASSTARKRDTATLETQAAMAVDVLSKIVGEPVKAMGSYIGNFGGYHAAEGGRAVVGYDPDSALAEALVPPEFRHAELAPSDVHALNDQAGGYGFGSGVLRMASYVLTVRKLWHARHAAQLETMDPAHKRLLERRITAALWRCYFFFAEKVANGVGYVSITGGLLATGLGYGVGTSALIVGHLCNIAGFIPQYTGGVATELDEGHLFQRSQYVAPWIVPESIVKEHAERLAARLAEAGYQEAADYVLQMAADNQHDAIEPLVAAVVECKNEQAPPRGGLLKRAWRRVAETLTRKKPERPSYAVDTATPHGQALSVLRERLVIDAADRIHTLQVIELAAFGETKIGATRTQRTITSSEALPSEAALVRALRAVKREGTKGRYSADRQNALYQVAEAPGRIAQSVAALTYVTAESVTAGSEKLFATASGAHGLSPWLLWPLAGFSVGVSTVALVRELRALRQAVHEGNANNMFYYGAGLASGALITTGTVIGLYPPFRPLGMIVAAVGALTMLAGKYCFNAYKQTPSPQSGRLRRGIHFLYARFRDHTVVPLFTNRLVRWLLRVKKPL